MMKMKKRVRFSACAAIIILCLGIFAPALSAAEVFIFPDAVTSIDEEAFYGNTSVVALSLKAGITYIGDRAFSGCDNLQIAQIKGDETVIGRNAFDPHTVIISGTNSAARAWAEANGCPWNPLSGDEIIAQPVSASADAGDTVTFSVSAQGVASYQWQIKRCDMDWTDTYTPGYDTDTLWVRANANRTVLQWRCVLTMNAGYDVYTEPVSFSLNTLSFSDIEVDEDSFVKYEVPLYSQDNYGICWSVSMQMVEDYQLGIEYCQEDALELSILRAMDKYGEDWQGGGEEFDVGKDDSTAAYAAATAEMYGLTDRNIALPDTLYRLLVMYGPIYMSYGIFTQDMSRYLSGHSVVLTGVDVADGTVYTNNPWGLDGTQEWDEAMETFYTGGGTPAYSEEEAEDYENAVWMLLAVDSPVWTEHYSPETEDEYPEDEGPDEDDFWIMDGGE